MKKNMSLVVVASLLLILSSCRLGEAGSLKVLTGAQTESTIALPDVCKTDPISVAFAHFSFDSSDYLVRVFSLSSAETAPHIFYSVPSDFVSDYGFESHYVDEELTFSTTEDHSFTGGSIAIDIYANVGAILIDGGIKIDLDASKSPSLAIVINGAGDIETTTDLALNSLSASIAGAGSLSFSGTAESAVYQIDGAGSIKAKDLLAKEVEASIDGAGSMEVYASSSLQASVDGAGKITYYGNPASIASQVEGVGLIVKG